MKTLGNNLDELRESGFKAVYNKVQTYCDEFNDSEPDPRYHIGRDFNIDLGGPILLIETEEDLKQIITTKHSPDSSRYLNILETPDCFDICEYMDNGSLVYILLCTHNGGGTTYVVNRTFADNYPNIEKSIFLTNVAWGDTSDGEDDADNS